MTYFSPHIWEHGEAREALVIEDIVKNHRWVLPVRNGDLPSKPILYHWIAALFALPLGLSDFVVRLPSVFGATFLAWLTYSVVAFATNRKAALLAVGVLVSTFEFWDLGTGGRVDMLFAALIRCSAGGVVFLVSLGPGDRARVRVFFGRVGSPCERPGRCGSPSIGNFFF